MPKPSIIFGIILIIAALAIAYMLFTKKPKEEGFGDIYGIYKDNRNKYVNDSKQKYNHFSEIQDPMSNFMGSTKQPVVDSANKIIQSAMNSSDIDLSNKANTLLGIKPLVTKNSLPPENLLFEEVKKCEAKQTRDSCAILDDPNYSNCGVCIKQGSPFSFENPGKHIGGLLLLPGDKEDAVAAVEGTGLNPTYYPTIGDCMDGMFFANREECEKNVNRVDCEEAGKSGGFDNGLTVEGSYSPYNALTKRYVDDKTKGKKSVIRQKCAKVLTDDNNVFIYEPKGRGFNVNLRAVVPKGTGKCLITVYSLATGKIVGSAENDMPGTEFLVKIQNVKENDKLQILVELEAPHRYNGKNELYQIQYPAKTGVINSKEAAKVCARYGSQPANSSDLTKADSDGANFSKPGTCSPGYTSDGTLRTLCGSVGANQQSTAGAKGSVWCFGVKPPNARLDAPNSNLPKMVIPDWNANRVSKHNPSAAPGGIQRAIILQWENGSGVSDRTMGIEPSLISVNGAMPRVIGNLNVFSGLDRFGQYNNSPIIKAPVYSNASKISSNEYWIWGKNVNQSFIRFDVSIPGIFLDSFYEEDRDVSKIGPLYTDPELEKRLRRSPCKQPGQGPGRYDISCLESTFIASGGDIDKGELATSGKGLPELNELGDISKIEAYLLNLYKIASTGKDASGKVAGANGVERTQLINDASMKMFGFKIATPCENVDIDVKGNVILVKKTYEDMDEGCLDHLWLNTGSELEAGQQDQGLSVKHTYTSIGERFSGLRKNEGSEDNLKKYPFTLCQRTGSLAPISEKGLVSVANMSLAQNLGTVEKVQKLYNTVYNNANNNTGNLEAQSSAVKQCYGIKKAEPGPRDPEEKGCWNKMDLDGTFYYLSGGELPGGPAQGNTDAERLDDCANRVRKFNRLQQAQINQGERIPPKEVQITDINGNYVGRDIVGLADGWCFSDHSKTYGRKNLAYQRWGKKADSAFCGTSKNKNSALIRQYFNPSSLTRWWTTEPVQGDAVPYFRQDNSTVDADDKLTCYPNAGGNFCKSKCANDPMCKGYTVDVPEMGAKRRQCCTVTNKNWFKGPSKNTVEGFAPAPPPNTQPAAGTRFFGKNPDWPNVYEKPLGCHADWKWQENPRRATGLGWQEPYPWLMNLSVKQCADIAREQGKDLMGLRYAGMCMTGTMEETKYADGNPPDRPEYCTPGGGWDPWKQRSFIQAYEVGGLAK